MAIGWRGQYFKYKDFYENMLTLYKQRRDLQAFMEAVLSLSTIIIFIVFAIKPTLLTIISLSNDVKGKREVLAALNQKVIDLQAANNLFIQNQNFIPDVDAAIFSTPQPDTVSKQVLGLGAKDSVKILGQSIGQVVLFGKSNTSTTTSDVKPLPGNALAMPISISVKGTYSDILTFMKDFENLRIPSKVDSFVISSSQTQEGNVIVGVITARIPYLGSL